MRAYWGLGWHTAAEHKDFWWQPDDAAGDALSPYEAGAGTSSIIPNPGTPGGSVNVTQAIMDSGDYTNAAGTTLLGDSIQDQSFADYVGTANVLFFDDDLFSTLTNNGTMWNSQSVADVIMGVMTAGEVVNSGEIVAQLQSTTNTIATAYGVYFSTGISGWDPAPQPDVLDNTGQIYALSSAGDATGVYVEFWSHPILNSGVIAAQSDLGDATGIDAEHGIAVTNAAGGSILAEGVTATGIFMGDGGAPYGSPPMPPDITNAGLIQAVSTDPDNASVGIFLVRDNEFVLHIDNSGTISADYAIYAASGEGFSQEVVTNETGGLIEGVIFLDAGDDQVVNHGTIDGIVDMGEGNDSVDNGAGTINGYTDLGFGDDSYIGGAGEDDVLGNRGDDVISGGDGQDLLLGGYGNDTLDGGNGSDGLYGEYGDDVITAGKGDFVDAGPGDDRIILNDFGGFAQIAGGTGFDTLVLPAAARILDLQPALAAGTINGIDDISLGSGNGLVVRPADVLALSDANTLEIQGDTSNHVYLLSGWTQTADQVIGGDTYHVYTAGGSELLLQDGIVATIQASAPAGAAGFDPVPGVPAPEANPVFLASDVSVVNYYSSFYDVTIYPGETWESQDGHPVFWGDCATLTNYGTVEGESDTFPAFAVNVNGMHLENYGLIKATGDAGAPYALAVRFNQGLLYNDGMFQATSVSGYAWGVQTWALSPFINDGTVFAQSDVASPGLGFATATGVMFENAQFFNNGTIHVIGDAALAVQADYGLMVNTGSIIATSTGTSPSVGILGGGGIYLTNSGTIQADVAIRVYEPQCVIENTGTIDGTLDFTINNGYSGGNKVVNSGTMAGTILFGSDNDHYNGQLGHHSGEIYGEAGNDFLNGGVDNEVFDGGSGNDQIVGGGGSDTAAYDDATGGVKVNLAISTKQAVGGGEGSDTLTAISDLSGSGFNDKLAGNSGANTLSGLAGNDTLDLSAGGNDTASGGDGNDTIVMGAALDATDRIDGGAGNDILVLAGDYSAGVTLADATMINVETLRFSAGFNYKLILADGNVANGATLTVDASALGTADALIFDGSQVNHGRFTIMGGHGNDTLTGGAGADVITGGAGNDTIDGGAGVDLASYAGATSGVAVSLANTGAQAVGGGQGTDTLTGIENLQGSNFNDVLRGDAGNNVLSGLGGSNTFDLSDGGDDIANGGGSSDTVNFGAAFTANDRVNGGAGNDTVTFNGDYSAGVTFKSSTMVQVENLSFAAGHSYAFTINNANVAAGATLTVDGSKLSAGDSLTFNGGPETDGTFVIKGGAGADTLTGGAGNDTIIGGAGNNVMRGGLGADSLSAGAGIDHFIYTHANESTGAGFDTISHFDASMDAFDFTFVFSGVNAKVMGGALSAATFDTDLGAAIGTGQLGMHHAVLFAPTSGDYAGDTFLIVDANNAAGYQAGQDFVFLLDHGANLSSLGAGDFI